MPLNGSSAVFRFSDAIYMPIAAQRVVNANKAGVHAANNDAMLEVAEAYFDLQQACGLVAINREAVANAKELSDVTGSYARTGQGLEADHRRALTELNHRRKDVQLYTGQLLVASANLVRILVLNPQSVIAPVEPAECIITLIPDDVPLDDLVIKGLRNRPELASAQELVEASVARLKQARLRPFIPSLAVSYAGGGFGGGQGSFFGDFGARGDFAASLFWELQNLGFGDVAIMRRRRFENEEANLQKLKIAARVAAEVVAAYRDEASGGAADQGVARDGGRGDRLAQAEHDQHSPGRRAAAGDAADRSASAHPGARSGSNRLSRLGAELQPAQFRLNRAIGQP